LAFGLSLQRRAARFQGFDLGLREDGLGGQLMLAVAFSHQLYIRYIDAGGFYRGRGELHQAVGTVAA
jgi:hypothetical protein